MKQAGIYYGSSSGKTESVATKIYQRLGKENASISDIAESSPEDLLKYKYLILGIPTWGIGELQDDWIDFLPRVEDLDLKGRTVALFGLGDQESYPDTFVDALGTLYDALLHTGCRITGNWSTLGYDFMESSAIRNGMFTGLVLDEENQSHMTDIRLDSWLKDISQELKLA